MRAGNSTLRSVIFSWLALMGLTLLSSVLALTNLGSMNALAGLIIAALQAALIAGFLMHAVHEQPIVRVVIAAGVIWFLILLTLTWTDYYTRGWLSVFGK